ncbi:MAG: AraC family transcriptional regulator [Comamonadaceae bacterium]|nr:MAG: AraC family transcriptional regulator [Comamonadaceae bacterium]
MAAPAHHSEVLASPWPRVYAAVVRSERHYGRHSHGTFGFGVVDAGAHRSSSGRGTVDAFAGQIVTTNPGEVHDGRPLGAPSRSWCTVYVEPALLASLAAQGDGDIAITQPVLVDAQLQRATRRLLQALRGWQLHGADALACEEALVQACGLLLARHANRRLAGDAAGVPLERIRQRIADDLLAPPSLAQLAAQAGIGRFQLLRRFAAVYGCTPHAFLLQQRAERARALIRQGSSLAGAAADAGFADQPHLTRIFTRQFGFTPGAWQRAVRPQ